MKRTLYTHFTGINQIAKPDATRVLGPIVTMPIHKRRDESSLDITLPEVVVTAKYPHEQRVIDTMNASNAEFMRRLRNNDRRAIHNQDGSYSTHVLGSADNMVFPAIQDVNGELKDYRGLPWQRTLDNAIQNKDYIKFPTEGDARYFGEHYKKYFPNFFNNSGDYQHTFKDGGNTSSNKGRRNPPKNNGPKTNNREQDKPQISWMKNWLSSRKDILRKNAEATTWGYTKYSPKRNKGDVRESGWRGVYYENPWNPITYLKGYTPTENRVNKIIYSQIENADDTPKQEVGYGSSNSYNMRGIYVEPNYWNNTGNYIAFAGQKVNPETKVHEFTHASHPEQQEQYIDKIIFKGRTPNVVPGKKQSSRDNAKELYGALQEFRYKNNLKPEQIIDQKYIDSHRELFKGNYLENIPDGYKIKLFNDVAQNNSLTQPIEIDSMQPLLLKDGGSIHNFAHADGGPLDTTLTDEIDAYPSEVIDNQYASGGHMSTYRIPKHRKVVETIKMTNGSILTREVDGSGYSRWFRNGKYITPYVLKTYKFYDKGIKGYRQLKNGFMHDNIRYDINEAAPVYTPTLNKLMSSEGEWYNHTHKADIRQSFKPSKKVITLRTKGSMNLADIPVNMLDSIAINSGRSNTPVKQNLGLVGKESTFGGFSHFQGDPIEKKAIFYPGALTNNRAYFESPAADYLKTLEKNVAGGYKEKAVAQRENRARKDYKHHGIVDNIPRFSPNVMADAFKRYSANPSGYNHNQGNYTSMVNRIGNEVWNEPHIQNWWNTEGKYYYNKGRSQGINYTYADGGSLESDEDNLLAPIIKYYEDSNHSLSIEDQNTFAKGGQMKKARQAVGYFVNKGLTKEQAAGLVGNLMRESGMNIGATNPNSGAYGLGQWLGSRKTRLFKRYGYHPTFEQQLDYIWDELNTSHRRGLQMLRASKTVNDAARNAFGYYEFSAGPEAAIRAMNSAGKNTKWKNPNGTYALNSGIKNAQMIFGEVPVTMDNAGDTLALDTPESTQSIPNIQPIISNDYAPVIAANLKELPTFGQEEDNDSSIPSFGPQYLAQNLDRLGMINPLNPFEKGYQLQSPKAIFANMQDLI